MVIVEDFKRARPKGSSLGDQIKRAKFDLEAATLLLDYTPSVHMDEALRKQRDAFERLMKLKEQLESGAKAV